MIARPPVAAPATETLDSVDDRRASTLDRAADALLMLGQAQRAELLAHRAEAMRAQVAR